METKLVIKDNISELTEEIRSIKYQPVKKVVGGKEIECEICTNERKLYHLTLIDRLREIIDTGEMRPAGESKSVSLSANLNHSYGGHIKITFNREKLDKLEPMCYFSHNTPAAEAYYKLEDKMNRESEYTRSLNDMRAEIGMQPDVYKKECEWTTREVLPVPKNSIKKIEYFITVPHSPYRVDCSGHTPHYVNLTSPDYDRMVSNIKQARELAGRVEVPFEVNSCFPFIQKGWYKYIKLDESNLEKLTKGEEPLITHEPPPEECRPIEGCIRD